MLIRRLSATIFATMTLSGCYIADLSMMAPVNANLNANVNTPSKQKAVDDATKSPVVDPSKTDDVDPVSTTKPEQPIGYITGYVNRMSGLPYKDMVVWAQKDDFIATTSVSLNSTFAFTNLPEATKAYRISVTLKDIKEPVLGNTSNRYFPWTNLSPYAAPFVDRISTSTDMTIILVVPEYFDYF